MFGTAKSKVGVLALTAVIVGVPVVGLAGPAGATPPIVVHCTGVPGELQPVINAAALGATVQIDGTCVGNFTISQSLTLTGSGTSAILDGANTGTTVTIVGGTVVLNNLTIQHGFNFFAGGIYNVGTLTINNSAVSHNTATGQFGGFGGGILNNGTAATLTVNRSILSGNTATDGGGIFNFGGTVTVNRSILSGNTATDGGGIFNFGGTATVSYSLLWNNTATANGGGIWNANGQTTVGYSIVSHNPGATTPPFTGGIYIDSGTVTVTKSVTT